MDIGVEGTMRPFFRFLALVLKKQKIYQEKKKAKKGGARRPKKKREATKKKRRPCGWPASSRAYVV